VIAGVFIGYKMYTALGYRPSDYKAWGKSKTPRLPAMIKFFKRCETENIPITCHCSPSGMYTHDINLYFDLESQTTQSEYYRWTLKDREKVWFYDTFVSPAAWAKVLKDVPKLKLCLAHFGGGSSYWADWKNNTHQKIRMLADKKKIFGNHSTKKQNVVTHDEISQIIEDWYNQKERDMFEKERDTYSWIRQLTELMEKKNGDGTYKYPNLYTDISFHFIDEHKREFLWLIENHPIVKERVLYGTDWYMTELDKKSIDKFVGDTKPVIDEISRDLSEKTGKYEDLWLTFTRVNPMKFFGIRSVADKFAEGLKSNLPDENKEEMIKVINDSLDIIKKSDVY
jgi:predicted TIM-barrel fold metal-dependent hydrolase